MSLQSSDQLNEYLKKINRSDSTKTENVFSLAPPKSLGNQSYKPLSLDDYDSLVCFNGKQLNDENKKIIRLILLM